MNNIRIYWDIRIVGNTITTRENAGSKVALMSNDSSGIIPNSTIHELTGPSSSKLGSSSGKTRWVRFRAE